MDSARADILAAESHLQTHGWVPRRSEAFRHLPPPELAQWLHGTAPGADCSAPALSGTGWTLNPVGDAPATGVHARWLDALEPA